MTETVLYVTTYVAVRHQNEIVCGDSNLCFSKVSRVEHDNLETLRSVALYHQLLLYQFDFQKCHFFGITSIWTTLIEIRLFSKRVEQTACSTDSTHILYAVQYSTAEKRNCLDSTVRTLHSTSSVNLS